MKIDDLIKESLKDPEFAKEFQKEGVVLKRTLDRVDLEEDVKIYEKLLKDHKLKDTSISHKEMLEELNLEDTK